MNRPNGYDNVSTGEFVPIELGGHRAVIIGVEETESKTGKPMVKVAIDFDKTDKQPEYFKEQYQNDERPDKKWPYQAVQYILTEDASGQCSSSFKRFITSVEKSCGQQCPWGAAFAKWFKNKNVGVIYGEVEEEYNGEQKMRHRLRFFCEYDKAADAKIPAAKLLDNAPAQEPKKLNEGFLTVPDGAGEEGIPF